MNEYEVEKTLKIVKENMFIRVDVADLYKKSIFRLFEHQNQMIEQLTKKIHKLELDNWRNELEKCR